MARGAFDDPGDPGEVRLGLLERAEVDERVRGHRGVADPAEPVVPVAHPTELLGQRGGPGREDRACGLVAQGLEGQGRARHGLGLDARQAQRVRPVGQPASVVRRRTWTGGDHASRLSVPARISTTATRRSWRGRRWRRRASAARRTRCASPRPRAQADRLAAAEDLQALVGDRLELHGQLPELRARREGELDGDLAVDLADEDRGVEVAAAARGGVEPVGDRQARPAGLHGHRPGHVALPRGCRR